MKCRPSFFGMKEMPMFDFTNETLNTLVLKSVNEKVTITGVQKKLSIHLSHEEFPRLTLVGYPAGYILKPQTEEYPMLPESEDVTMDMARICGIDTVPHGLITLDNGELAFVTKRVDRLGTKKLAMEDFCQLSERLSEDKYHSSYEQCAKIVKAYSVRSGLDLTELFLRIVFSFITGNSDMHLKNFSLLESADGYVLSPAYDLLPVNLIVPEDSEEMALTLCGKKKKIDKKDFFNFAERIELDQKVAQNMINKVIKKENDLINLINESFLSDSLKKQYVALLKTRIQILK